MWPFKRKSAPQPNIGRGFQLYPDEAPRFPVSPVEPGPFRIMHVQAPALHTSNAGKYAYDTLALIPMFPINHIFQVQTPMLAAAPGQQFYVQNAAFVYELPQPNGQIFSQPLYDPNAVASPDDLTGG